MRRIASARILSSSIWTLSFDRLVPGNEVCQQTPIGLDACQRSPYTIIDIVQEVVELDLIDVADLVCLDQRLGGADNRVVGKLIENLLLVEIQIRAVAT